MAGVLIRFIPSSTSQLVRKLVGRGYLAAGLTSALAGLVFIALFVHSAGLGASASDPTIELWFVGHDRLEPVRRAGRRPDRIAENCLGSHRELRVRDLEVVISSCSSTASRRSASSVVGHPRGDPRPARQLVDLPAFIPTHRPRARQPILRRTPKGSCGTRPAITSKHFSMRPRSGSASRRCDDLGTGTGGVLPSPGPSVGHVRDVVELATSLTSRVRRSSGGSRTTLAASSARPAAPGRRPSECPSARHSFSASSTRRTPRRQRPPPRARIAAIPHGANSVYLAVVHRRDVARAIVIQASVAILALGLAVLLLGPLGDPWRRSAWLVAQVLVALVIPDRPPPPFRAPKLV